MKALSIKQPWAWLVAAGCKDIENRNWRIGRNSRHGPYSSYDYANFSIELPSRIYVHAGKHFDDTADSDWIERIVNNGDIPDVVFMNNGKPTIIVPENRYLTALCEPMLNGALNTAATLGAIIGEVDITDCVTESTSPWFTGQYGFVLKDAELYKTPIPCRGQLGFFDVPDEVIKQIEAVKA